MRQRCHEATIWLRLAKTLAYDRIMSQPRDDGWLALTATSEARMHHAVSRNYEFIRRPCWRANATHHFYYVISTEIRRFVLAVDI